ncbi:MAG: hypothetical protein ACREOF_05365 [Gemmatimonadales bacterium]
MLPPGWTADIAPVAEQARLRPRLPGAQTVARLAVGGCACPTRLSRDGEGERHLRHRYAALGVSRDRVIAALDRHRRGDLPRGDPPAWRAALAGFVAEHARNAGPTLYYLGFGLEPSDALLASAPATSMTAAAVRADPDTWLGEATLIEVTR